MALALLLLVAAPAVLLPSAAAATEPVAAPTAASVVESRFPGLALAGDALPEDWIDLVPWLEDALQTRDVTPAEALVRVLTGETRSAVPPPAHPEPGPDVETNLTLRLVTLQRLELEGTLDVRRHEVAGVDLDAARLREGWLVAHALGQPMADAFLADLEAQMRDALHASLTEAFPDATSIEVTRLDVHTPSLDPHHGALVPLRVAAAARVLEPTDLASSGDAAAALLNGGARVAVAVPFVTPPGHRQSFTLLPPAGLQFESPTEGALSADGRSLRVAFDNAYGLEAARTTVGTLLRDRLALAPLAEQLDARIEVRLRALDPDVDQLGYLLDVRADLAAFDIASRFPDALPAHVQLDVLSADTLRRLHQAGVLNESALAAHEQNAAQAVRSWLEAEMGPVEDVSGAFDRASLAAPTDARYDLGAPLHYRGAAMGAYALPEGAARQLDLALRIGARVALDLPLAAPAGGEATYVLHPPRGLAFVDVEGGRLLDASGAAEFVVPAGEAARAHLALVDPAARSPVETDATMDVLVDVRDVALDPLSDVPATLLVTATLRAALESVPLPEEFAAQLDPRVELTHLSSDGVRLLWAEGVVDEENLALLEARLLDAARERLVAMGLVGEVHGAIDRATLAADARGPVVFEARADLARALVGSPAEDALAQPGAVALYRTTQTLRFPGLVGIDATYTVLLPPGIAVVGLTGDAEPVSDGGRDGFMVRPGGEGAAVEVALAVTPVFVVLKVWPLLALALGALAGLVALVARRRRRAA